MNNTYTAASKRQDKIYATDALLASLKVASNEIHMDPDPVTQFQNFRMRRIAH